MVRTICSGSFFGGEIEPGTFHQSVMVDPRDEERDPSTDGTDVTDSQASAESEDA